MSFAPAVCNTGARNVSDVEEACVTDTGIPHTVTLLRLMAPAAVEANPWPESVTEAPPPGPTLMLEGEVTDSGIETLARLLDEDLGSARPCEPTVTSTLWVPAGVAPTVHAMLVLFQAVIVHGTRPMVTALPTVPLAPNFDPSMSRVVPGRTEEGDT